MGQDLLEGDRVELDEGRAVRERLAVRLPHQLRLRRGRRAGGARGRGGDGDLGVDAGQDVLEPVQDLRFERAAGLRPGPSALCAGERETMFPKGTCASRP